MHFTYLVKGAGKMFHTGQPTWPAERTLMTSALLNALLISKIKNGAVVLTDYLDFKYSTDWNWKQPPPHRPGDPRTSSKAVAETSERLLSRDPHARHS